MAPVNFCNLRGFGNCKDEREDLAFDVKEILFRPSLLSFTDLMHNRGILKRATLHTFQSQSKNGLIYAVCGDKVASMIY